MQSGKVAHANSAGCETCEARACAIEAAGRAGWLADRICGRRPGFKAGPLGRADDDRDNLSPGPAEAYWNGLIRLAEAAFAVACQVQRENKCLQRAASISRLERADQIR